ncbi:MAG: hypothetical protein KDD89_13420, partial [Anaerolineales bacterium]|nr:hypothetical protein [Anaerolineales bacterium]
MKTLRFFLVLALLVVAATAVFTTIAPRAQSAPHVAGTAALALSPATQPADIGDLLTVAVLLNNPTSPVSGFQFEVTFDPNIIAVQGITTPAENHLAANGRQTHCPATAQPSADTVRYACASTGTAEGVTSN